MNPGLKFNSHHSFPICHWNLNSLSAHNFIVSLLRTYININNFDGTCLSGTYWHLSVASNDGNLYLPVPSHNVLRAGNLSNTKRMVFKDLLLCKLSNIHYLQEPFIFEIILGDIKWDLISLCRSPSQFNGNFEFVTDTSELNINVIIARNPYIIALLGGGFDAHTDTHTIDGITSLFGLEQLIHRPNYITGESSICIDLIFASQLSAKFGNGIKCWFLFTWKLLFTPLYIKTIPTNSIFQIQSKVLQTLSYEREVWHFNKVIVDHIRKAISDFQWVRSFANTNVKEMTFLILKTIKNVLSNYASHKIMDERAAMDAKTN